MRSGFFNSELMGYDVEGMPVFDRAEDAEFFSKYFSQFISNGIFPNPSTNMQVLAVEDMKVKVDIGVCYINGKMGWVEPAEMFEIEESDLQTRIDRIVARLDYATRDINLFVKKGTASGNPVAPDVQRDYDIYEIALADIRVNANVIEITQENITDLRLNTALCGIVANQLQHVDTTTIFNQYQDWLRRVTGEAETNLSDMQEEFENSFNAWFQTIQDILDGDTAGHLQTQINQIRQENIIVSQTEPETDRRKIWIQKGRNIIPTDFEAWEEGHYNATAGLKEDLLGSTRVRLGFLIKVKSGTSYYFNSFNNECKFIVRTYDKNGKFLRSVGAIENSNATVINSNEEYISVTIYNPSNSNFSYEDYKTSFKNGTIKPFICLDSEQDKTFEEYINNAIHIKNNHNIYEELINEDIKYKVSKVDKVDGKGLSTNDFTDTYKTKLDGIATGANKTIIENVLTSTSTVNALSSAQGKALNDKINGVILYNNTNGTAGTITLNSNKSNFKYIDIFATLDEKEIYVRLVVQTTNTTRLRDSFSENGNQYSFRDELLTIANTIISRNKMAKFTITTSGETALASSTTQFKIKKVVGYK